MLTEIKERCQRANCQLASSGLIILTWGNVSERTDDDLVVIKPSGVPYEELKPEHMVVVDMDGKVVEGQYRPSSDTPTHLELYKAFPSLKGICHTHSSYATVFAQAGQPIACYGTTHADYFYGAVPCTRSLTQQETESAYEQNTGKVIIETFMDKDVDAIPGVLVRQHGVFTWGKDAMQAVERALVLEELAKMNYRTLRVNPIDCRLPQYVLDKHYLRKHGANAYYGQK
ncbi:MAG: L-ribulose-5-phosphate 4-epimerase AraD [Akkermansiaceae bacterium]|nr:L-ribulose-5-phosphate 4-epimerase AraD [Akkermansiaceae bacterium]